MLETKKIMTPIRAFKQYDSRTQRKARSNSLNSLWL